MFSSNDLRQETLAGLGRRADPCLMCPKCPNKSLLLPLLTLFFFLFHFLPVSGNYMGHLGHWAFPLGNSCILHGTPLGHRRDTIGTPTRFIPVRGRRRNREARATGAAA